MDIIIIIVIIAVIYIYSIVKKLSSIGDNAGNMPRGVMDEVFPPIEPMNEDNDAREDEPAMQPANAVQKETFSKEQPSKAASIASIIAAVNDAKKEPLSVNKNPVEQTKKDGFAIKDKSDAKRAIIYSEIFNKKYN